MGKYKVESFSAWFIVDTATKREAYSEGVREWGRGCVRNVELASKEDIEYYINLKGEDSIRAESK